MQDSNKTADGLLPKRAIFVALVAGAITLSCTTTSEAVSDQPRKPQQTSTIPMSTGASPVPTPVVERDAPKRAVSFTSAFTNLGPSTCKPVGEGEEPPEICEGYAGYKVFVSYHGAVTRIYVGKEINDDLDSWLPSDFPSFIANQAGTGQTIEWRLANGVPFACIVREQIERGIAEPAAKGTTNVLVVKSLRGFSAFESRIDATKSLVANASAQRSADSSFKQ
ncbi:MAG TPA: hypothetical protein PLP21_19265 [Pyrinomonadaceae bacterium]|nr:hypothetical protein [Pyrinomonadaceae bacterium]